MSVQVPVPVEREAWPANSILDYHHVRSGEWGYMDFYKDATFKFIHEAPSDAEILKRWKSNLLQNIRKNVSAPMVWSSRHIKSPLVVLRDTDNKYFIGAVLVEDKASKESAQTWETYELAETALLLNEWNRVETFTEIEFQ